MSDAENISVHAPSVVKKIPAVGRGGNLLVRRRTSGDDSFVSDSQGRMSELSEAI